MTLPTAPTAVPLPDVNVLRDAVVRGDTRNETWRRAELQVMESLIDQHEEEIIQALQDDLSKPTTEAMVELLALRQELRL